MCWIGWLSVFIQSEVPQHLELCMIFSCLAPLGWLERCPTYKEQLREVKTRDLHTYAFLGYPVLQAADILLYRAHAVPVGEDQLPHLELTREIGRRFNGLYQKELFPEPAALLTQSPRLLGLDGRKMSKSYNNTINLSDPAEMIKAKVSSMITDPQRAKRTDKGDPSVCNVHAYYEVFFPEKKTQVEEDCRSAALGCTDCKKMFAQRLIETLAPFQERRAHFAQRTGAVEAILHDGKESAAAFAAETMAQVKAAMKLRNQ
jgi:tryptophanyl-tRNA synthetase